MSNKFAAEAYRAYVADTASELELKSIDVSGMTADEIYQQMVLLIPYFISRKLDCCLIFECTDTDGTPKHYYKVILDSIYFNSDGEATLYGRLDWSFDSVGEIQSSGVGISEDKGSTLGANTQNFLIQMMDSTTFSKIWYR